MLAEPAVKDWLSQKAIARTVPPPAVQEETTSVFLANKIAAVREHFGVMAEALPRVPGVFAAAANILLLEFDEHGLASILLPVFGFAVLGIGAIFVYRRLTAGFRRWVSAISLNTIGGRLLPVVSRRGFGLGMVLSFAFGSTGAFLVFDWPILPKEIALGYLFALLVFQFSFVLGRFLFAPPSSFMFESPERFRIVPVSLAPA